MQPTSIEIIKKLKAAGFEAYWAGGCVRDMLLGIKPKDYDIVTSAKPDEIEKVLEHTIPIGKEFGVILAIEQGHHFEVATFRSDAGYSDGRRPDAVIFTDAQEDAKRRDFTINGMFYDPLEDKIIDYVGGQQDLEARLIRFIGRPTERILEDHLRILRAIRFKNTLNFQYEPETYQAIQKHAPLLIDKVSNERIRDELNKIIVSPYAVNAFQDMEDTRILNIILPEIAKMKGIAQPYQYHKEGDVWTHAMQSLKALPETASMPLRWATLLHDVGKPETFKLAERIRFDTHDRKSAQIARKLLSRLHFENSMIDEVCWLIEHHMMVMPLVQMPKGRRLAWFHQPYFKNLLELFYADARGTTPPHTEIIDQIAQLYHDDLKEMPVPPPPLLHGEDIMKIMKIKPGKKVGFILDRIREMQLGGELQTKKQALEWLKKIDKEIGLLNPKKPDASN
jgi:poly(A) polymerase